MEEEFYDIEKSLGNKRLYFLPGKVRNSFRFSYISTLIALIGFGTVISIFALVSINDVQGDENGILTFKFMCAFGILSILFGLEYGYSVNKLRVVKGTNDTIKNFKALHLALEKSGYYLIQKSDTCITAEKHVRCTSQYFHFNGFVKDDNVYYIIYNSGKGISIFTTVIKPLRIHEFEEFFEYALKQYLEKQN